ncbi:MAG: hypothetical protein NUW08_00860 [Candidatus Uhrbacteria bacterium]|nr:hypothetical protein [Candidatus Uhrbacteria bacterium]
MPMRASGKEIGSSVGRMIFRGQDAKRIERRLEKVGDEKLKVALTRRGAGDVDTREIAKAMSGEGKGWSPLKYKKVVAALQDVEVAQKAKSASAMVLKASRDAQQALEGPRLTPEQLKEKMKGLARERRGEANAEEDAGEGTGILDRMRGAMGMANKAEQTTAVARLAEASGGKAESDRTVRGLREELRKDLGLQSRMRLPKPKNQGDVGMGFQS